MRVSSMKSAETQTIKMLVYGESGVGKTSLAKTTGAPTLVVSAESGLLSIAGHDIDVVDISTDDNGVQIPKEKRVTRLGEVYAWLNKEEQRKKYKWVIVDSLSEISQNVLEALQLEYPERKDSLPMYGENLKRLRSLVKSFRDLQGYNVMITALATVEKDDAGLRYITCDLVGSFAGKLPSFFDEVLYMYVDKEGKRLLLTEKSDKVVAKDRSGKLSKIEVPDLSVIAKKIKGEK